MPSNSKSKRLKGLMNKDIISELPEALLHHILSFLQVRESVVTRLLSKRWKSLWNSIPILDFGETSHTSPIRRYTTRKCAEKPKLLMNFVEKLLLHRQHESTILKFRFCCSEQVDSSQVVSSWLPTLINHKIQRLSLIFHYKSHCGSLMFPFSLFTCESLTTLRLGICCLLNLPLSISLPNLKAMTLEFVIFPDDYSIHNLLSSCPVLEDLNLMHCNCVNINTLCISSPVLKRLCIFDYKVRGSGWGNCDINISAPNIYVLILAIKLPTKISLCHLSSTVTARIRVIVEKKLWKQTTLGNQHLALKFFQSLSDLKRLVIYESSSEVFSHNENLLAQLPIFKNLIILELWRNKKLSIRKVLNFLQATPNLKHLWLCDAKYEYNSDDLSTVIAMPQCLMYHLQFFGFSRYSGDQHELDVIEFFLKNARGLEKMFIFRSTDLAMEREEELFKWLIKVPKSSERCDIQVKS